MNMTPNINGGFSKIVNVRSVSLSDLFPYFFGSTSFLNLFLLASCLLLLQLTTLQQLLKKGIDP